MIHKAQKIDSEEWVEGYYWKNPFHSYLVTFEGLDSEIIKPETLQVQCSDGDWVNVDDVQIIAKVCECDYPLVRNGYCGNCQRDLI